jgi:tRNA-binding protein
MRAQHDRLLKLSGEGLQWVESGHWAFGAEWNALPKAQAFRHLSAMTTSPTITFDQFAAVDIRVGRIVAAEAFPQARKPAFKLVIDFGPEIGTKRSSAQITEHYTLDELPGRLVTAVVNFPPRQIGPFMSEVLTLGFPDADSKVVLVRPDCDVPVGGRLF